MENQIYHHGVKGMKWGVRRAEKRALRADQAIRRIGTTKKANKLRYEDRDAEARENYTGKKAKHLKRVLAENKAAYDSTEVDNNYAIARQKAKKDKSYKKTTEYIKARNAFSKQQSQRMLFGELGHQRIETLKNMGRSEKAAKGKVIGEQVLAGLGMATVSIAAGLVISKYSR